MKSPYEYNQTIVDHFCNVHGFCMDHVLDDDKESVTGEYAGYNEARRIVGVEMKMAANDLKTWEQAQHTAPVPVMERVRYRRRIRAAA